MYTDYIMEESMNTRTKTADRLFFMDDLRAITVLLVVVFHVSVGFMDKVPQWWYAISPRRSAGYTLLVIIADVFMMPVMFFIAGYFTQTSLQRRGAKQFIAGRLLRLGLPWIVCVLLIAPALAYRTALNYGYGAGFTACVKNDFPGKFYTQGPSWFLGVLLLFSCLAAAQLPRRSGRETTPVPAARLLMAAALASFGGMVCSCLYFPADAWLDVTKVLVVQPARIAGYAAYFWLGLRAGADGWFLPEGYRPGRLRWGAAAAAACVLWVMVKAAYPSPSGAAECLIYAAAHTAFCVSACMAALAMAAGRQPAARPLLPAKAAGTFFGVYLLHLPVLLLLAGTVTGLNLPHVTQWTLLILGTVSVSYAASAILVKSPYTCKVLG